MLNHMFSVARSLVREHVTKVVKRSSLWPGVRREHLKLFPTCAACASTDHLQVHHCKPFYKDPALELDMTNLITLCMGPNECHLKIGHGNDFHHYNPNVRADAAEALANPKRITEIQARSESSREREMLPPKA
jgi:5-methylcytosine-specific restriction endonuclease McrA